MWLARVAITAGLVTVMACKSSTSPGCSGTCVTIQDFSFTPSAVMVKAGTIVTWVNDGPSAHTTTSDGAVWDSGTLSPPSGGGAYGGGTAGGTYQVTFNTPGTYPYHCKLHPPSVAAYASFTGTITVTQ
jgi:plastocyanin